MDSKEFQRLWKESRKTYGPVATFMLFIGGAATGFIIAGIDWVVLAALLMFLFSIGHNVIPAVPPLGFWASLWILVVYEIFFIRGLEKVFKRVNRKS